MSERQLTPLEKARQRYKLYDAGKADQLDKCLFFLIEASHPTQRERIRRGFPNEVAAVEELNGRVTK
jgi:hypothetical protein